MAEDTIIVFIDESGVGQEFVINGSLMNQQLQADGSEIVFQLDGQNIVEGNYVCEVPSQVEVQNDCEMDAFKVLGIQPAGLESEAVAEEESGLLKGRKISTLGKFGPTKYLPVVSEAENKDNVGIASEGFETFDESNCVKVEQTYVSLEQDLMNDNIDSNKKRISKLDFVKGLEIKKENAGDLTDFKSEDPNAHGSDLNSIQSFSVVDSGTNSEEFDPNLPFRCSICNKSFKLDITLELHKLSHSEPYVSSRSAKKNGISDGIRNYQCPVCDFQCPLKRTLKTHANDEHDLAFIFTCHKCKFSGLSSKEYSDHLQSLEHGENDTKFKIKHKAAARPFLCTQCGFRTTDKHRLERHMLIHMDKKEYPCPFCSYRGKTDFYLKKHMRTHSQDKNYQCTMCSYVSNDPYGLTRHIKNMHAKRQDRYKCRECNSTFAEMCELRVHAMLKHGSSDTLFCRYCTYSCKDKGEYKKHVQIHYGENLYMCDTCEFTCRSMALLKRHLLRHSNVRSHKCPKCSRTFHEKGDLKRHMKNHSSERPFQCSICEYSCKFRNTLTLHMKVHSDVKGYSCTYCDYSTKYPCNLKKHMAIHEDVKRFLCQFCSYKASLKPSLKRHMERVHKFTGKL